MILQSLYQYYQRCHQEVSATGFQPQRIPFIIHLDQDGQFLQFSDTREKKDGKKIAKTFQVPASEKVTNKIIANLFWGKPEYVLGIGPQHKKAHKVSQAHAAFLEKVQEFGNQHPEIDFLWNILKFLKELPVSQMQQEPLWPEIVEGTGSLLTFQILGHDSIICEHPLVVKALQVALQQEQSNRKATEQGTCLITGNPDSIARLHPPVKGIPGGMSSGTSLVSCNFEAASFHGKSQGYISPISKTATHAYTTALNHLLSLDSRQKLQLAGTTVVFWAEILNPVTVQLEDQFASFFTEEEAPPAHQKTSEVRKLYQSPWHGKPAILEAGQDLFCILGLSVSSGSRLAVKFWHTLPLDQLSESLNLHFEDLTIIHDDQEPGYLPIKRLLQQLDLDPKHSSNLESGLFESILLGSPYPLPILQHLLLRIHAVPKDSTGKTLSKVTFATAALLKAFLNRYYRRYRPLEKEITVSLDETNTNIGYCLGRLFAVLEKIQKDAQGFTSIRERYYAAASSRPAVALTHLMALKNHHLSKLKDQKDKVTFYEKRLSQIMNHIATGFPMHLHLFEQGAFSVGYYHQQHALYTKATKNTGSSVRSVQLELEGVFTDDCD